PERPWLRALRAVGVFLVSLLVVLDPAAALEIAATVAGGYGIYYAVTEVLVLVERPAAAADEADRVRSHRRALAVAAATPIAIVVLAVIILTGGAGGTAKAAGDRNPKTCNGYARSCATSRSTRSRSPPPTTRWRRPAGGAGSSPIRTAGSASSST